MGNELIDNPNFDTIPKAHARRMLIIADYSAPIVRKTDGGRKLTMARLPIVARREVGRRENLRRATAFELGKVALVRAPL